MSLRERYIIRGGQPGAERLKILARATWPATQQFLKRAGLREGMRCLDVGCGSGEISFRLLSMVGTSGDIVGLDADPDLVKIAQQVARQREVKIDFRLFNIEDDDRLEPAIYDFIVVRLLLSHLNHPEIALAKLVEALRPGGILTAEDVDFGGHFSYPSCPAFERYVRWYEIAARAKGGDPCIGPRLLGMLREVGLREVKLHVVLPTFYEGDGKQMALLTLQNIREAVLQLQLATEAELDQTVAELEAFTQDLNSTMSLPKFFQLWGTK